MIKTQDIRLAFFVCSQIIKIRLKFPLSFHVGDNSIPLHLVFEVLAFFIAFRYYLFLKNNKGDIINSENRSWILIAAVFGSLIGSRLIGGLEHPEILANQSNRIFFHFYENKTVLGGFWGGLFAVEIVKKIIGEKKASGDLFTYPMILGLIIGRIGCFCNGVFEDTVGTPTDFVAGMDLGDGISRHPIILYEILFLIMLWISLVVLEKKYRLQNGARFKIFLFSYFLFRFCCDFIKPHYAIIFGLSTIQLTSITGIIWYYKYILNPRKLLSSST